LPAIGLCALAAQQGSFFKPVDQFHDRVMAQLHSLSKFPNAWLNACGQSSQSQHQHVLLRLEIRAARGFLAAIQKYPDLISEFR
jgi:hypothetical protein